MQGLANSYAFWILVFVVLAVVFLLPTLIGLIRGADRLALVFLVWVARPSWSGRRAGRRLAAGWPPPRPFWNAPRS